MGIAELEQARASVIWPDPTIVYLDGNSLGQLTSTVRERVIALVDDEWGPQAVRGWQHWVDLPSTVGDLLGASMIGAGPGQVVVTDTVTTNLYRTAYAAVAAAPVGRRVIVTDDRNFPTDRYVLQAIAQQIGAELRVVSGDPLDSVSRETLAAALAPGDVALVSLCLVDYRGGALLDAEAITAQVHEAGALMLWDLSHAVGSVPVELDRIGADLAVGCTYKYLNAGPGAPGFLYVNGAVVDRLTSPIPGWWSTPDMFDMDAPYTPDPGVRRFLTGTPSIFGLVCVEASLTQLAGIGIETLRAESMRLTERLAAGVVAAGWELASPTDPERRGGHIVVRHPEAHRIGAALLAAGVIPDVREPDLVRLSPAPLSSTDASVDRAIDVLADVLATRAWEQHSTKRARVT